MLAWKYQRMRCLVWTLQSFSGVADYHVNDLASHAFISGCRRGAGLCTFLPCILLVQGARGGCAHPVKGEVCIV